MKSYMQNRILFVRKDSFLLMKQGIRKMAMEFIDKMMDSIPGVPQAIDD